MSNYEKLLKDLNYFLSLRKLIDYDKHIMNYKNLGRTPSNYLLHWFHFGVLRWHCSLGDIFDSDYYDDDKFHIDDNESN